MIKIQQADFNLADEYASLRQNTSSGAIVTFVGLVRDFNQGSQIQTLSLEHYPGMTEKALQQIEDEARLRWPLQHVLIIHRVGDLALGDQIVLVATSSAHRHAAFESCEFIMDYLKTQAPFWKKETTAQGTHWVDAREVDQQRLTRWQN